MTLSSYNEAKIALWGQKCSGWLFLVVGHVSYTRVAFPVLSVSAWQWYLLISNSGARWTVQCIKLIFRYCYSKQPLQNFFLATAISKCKKNHITQFPGEIDSIFWLIKFQTCLTFHRLGREVKRFLFKIISNIFLNCSCFSFFMCSIVFGLCLKV